jgi:hypothetical protein
MRPGLKSDPGRITVGITRVATRVCGAVDLGFEACGSCLSWTQSPFFAASKTDRATETDDVRRGTVRELNID